MLISINGDRFTVKNLQISLGLKSLSSTSYWEGVTKLAAIQEPSMWQYLCIHTTSITQEAVRLIAS